MDYCWLQGSARSPSASMRRLVLGFVILMALLTGAALIGAYALPWLMSAQRLPQTEHAPAPSNVTSVPKDMNALVRAVLCLAAWQQMLQPPVCCNLQTPSWL